MKPLTGVEVQYLLQDGVDFAYPRLVATIAEQHATLKRAAAKISDLLGECETSENEKEELRMQLTAQTANVSQLDLEIMNLTRQVRAIRDQLEASEWKTSQS